ncbi:Lysine-specific metallo-endopeptidase, partial [Luteibacter sp. UNC138MFCol5.1]|uniref:M35 family metallo-endopeptidase n=1 Tax=Luteibacter sp. UNC138MFCol5.1 TaxID=1502774 RepID=UPI0008CDC56B
AGWGLDDNARVYETLVASRKRIAADLDMRCGCPGSGENASASALTETRYTIRFCPKFFALPEADAYASRVGTLVHEYTHFNALYPGTGDYVYGWQKAEELAKKDRSNAVRNADNFEYFVMDTRPYDP